MLEESALRSAIYNKCVTSCRFEIEKSSGFRLCSLNIFFPKLSLRNSNKFYAILAVQAPY